jgi:hypothetical protein
MINKVIKKAEFNKYNSNYPGLTLWFEDGSHCHYCPEHQYNIIGEYKLQSKNLSLILNKTINSILITDCIYSLNTKDIEKNIHKFIIYIIYDNNKKYYAKWIYKLIQPNL